MAAAFSSPSAEISGYRAEAGSLVESADFKGRGQLHGVIGS